MKVRFNRHVVTVACAALMAGCSSTPHYVMPDDGYAVEFDRMANGITLGEVRAVNIPLENATVAMLDYSQSLSDRDFDYLVHAYSPIKADKVLDGICRAASIPGYSWTNPLDAVQDVSFSIDGSPVEMIFATTEEIGVVGVNSSYCQDGGLSAMFMAGPHMSWTPWVLKAERTLHILRNGRFEFETMPGFAMVTTPRGTTYSGLLVVRGQHRVEVPVVLTPNSRQHPGEVVIYSAQFFDNPQR